MAQVIFKDKKNPSFTHISAEIIFRNLTGQTTKNDYFELAWEAAVEDNIVDPARKADYEFDFVYSG